jgi:hypothetical protein
MLFSCSGDEMVVQMDGKFIFGNHGLSILDLGSNEVDILVDTPFRLIKYFDLIDDEKTLISAYELNATEGREKIEIWSLDGSLVQEIGLGSNAVYFSKHDIVVFHDSQGNLAYKPLSDTESSATIIEHNNKFQNKPVIKTGEDSFLYIKEVDEDYGVFEFSFILRESVKKSKFKQCYLDKSLWVPELHSLICQIRKPNGKLTGEFSLVGSAEGVVTLDFGVHGAWPLTTFRKGRFVLLQQRTTTNFGTKEIHPLWAFDLVERKSVKVAENIYVPSEIKEI